jgi:hypothetical protein
MIFTNVNRYASVHEAFRPEVLGNLYRLYGIPSFAIVLDDGNYPLIDGVKYCHKNDNYQKEFIEYCKHHKVKKVCNFIDYLTHDISHDYNQIYFVRSLYAANKNIETLNEEWLLREIDRINSADVIITDSPNSQKAIHEHYQLESELCWEYVNPNKYHKIGMDTNPDNYYIIGRHDKEKRFNLIKDQNNVTAIGQSELGSKPYLNIKSHGVMPFEDYIKYIKDATFGLFPALWESNGYSVQECLAMGKIPIVQVNSGGNERLCNSSNSIIIDYNNDNWKSNPNNLKQMQNAAKETLTYSMYSKSLEKFVEIMYS